MTTQFCESIYRVIHIEQTPYMWLHFKGNRVTSHDALEVTTVLASRNWTPWCMWSVVRVSIARSVCLSCYVCLVPCESPCINAVSFVFLNQIIWGDGDIDRKMKGLLYRLWRNGILRSELDWFNLTWDTVQRRTVVHTVMRPRLV
jgi:Pyruvate/2-oxoacid:ferredoxin oxidoreductase delta subunit